MRLRFIGQRHSRSIIVTGYIILTFLCLSSICFAEEGEWTRKADMPTPRQGLSVCAVNGKIYAIGGDSVGNDNAMSSWEALSNVEEYDPATDTWTKKADMPTPRWWLSTAVVNGRIYAIGGTQGEPWSGISTVEEYDPAADTWTRKADMPKPRHLVSCSVVNDRIYAIGGYSGGQVPWVYEYDPATDIWTRKADMPSPRYYLGTSVVNGRIYAIGGGIVVAGYSTPVSMVEEYNPSTDVWTKKADMPVAAFTHIGAHALRGRIYVIGYYSIQFYIYDPAAETWTQLYRYQVRYNASSAVINGMIYVVGGGEPPVASVDEYDTGVGVRVKTVVPQEGWVTGGESVAIYGKEFPSDAEVTIGGNPLAELKVTDTLITGLTPPGAEGEWNILIAAPSIDFRISAGKFVYNPVSNIMVSRITPANGKQAGGEAGSITGSGFLPGATVTIGGNPATDVGVTPTLIIFTIPSGTEGAKDVVVTNPDGQKATLRGAYTYNPFPVIKKVEPEYGGPLKGGTQMTITGSSFMEGVSVTIGENPVQQLDFFSPTELRLRTPPGAAGTKAVRVTNPDGQEAVKEDAFTYNPAPIISSVSPSAGPLEGGTPITITGTGFIHPNVLIGGAEANIERVLPTKITALTPLSDAGIKDVTVVNADGQRTTLRGAFIYNDAPVITRVTPGNGRLAGGTRITIQGGGFQPGAEVRISINQGAYRSASSVEVMSSSIITALTPPGQPGAENVLVLNPDIQIAVLPEGYTYNPMPVITRLIPDHGPSSGGATITVEGSGFLLGARVVIGERPATTMVRDDMTIEAVAPPNPQGVWDVRVINPDTQEVVMPGGYVSVGELVYNYPNPFYASQGTTFRYVTKDPVLSVTVKIFNLRGRPIGAARQLGSNEVKWCDPSVHAGLYVYILEAEFEGGRRKQVRNVMEVME